MNPRKLLAAVVVLGLVAWMAYSTLAAQRVQCDVCMDFRGRRNCASATGPNPTDAARTAQTTACGTIAQGMDEGIACDRATPVTARCETR